MLDILTNHTHAFFKAGNFIADRQKRFKFFIIKNVRLILPECRDEIKQIIAISVKFKEVLFLAEKAKIKILCLV